MNKATSLLLLFVFMVIAGCGAKTKTELVETAKLQIEFTTEKNYQSVYRQLAEKFVECGGTIAQYMQRNVYSDLGIGEFYLHGADAAGYIFWVEVKRIRENSTSVRAYSKISTGAYPELMDIVRMGTYGQLGCPSK